MALAAPHDRLSTAPVRGGSNTACGPGDGRVGNVGDSHHRHLVPGDLAEGEEGVDGLTRLADPDHERARFHRPLPAPQLGGDLALDGDPGPGLQRRAGGEAGVQAGTATDHEDAPDRFRVEGGEHLLGQEPGVVLPPPPQRGGDRHGPSGHTA